MEVCERCHEADKEIVGCYIPLAHHSRWYRGFVGKCDICGRTVNVTYTCAAYQKYVEENRVCMSKMP